MGERNSFERPCTNVHIRGSFLSVGDKVCAGTPFILNPLPDDQMPNRLGLANWLVSDDNPLTARVTVNRYWEQLFGRGIVETSEDFGTQGTPPTNPLLLDWLATEFMRDGWSMKKMLRLMVTSATLPPILQRHAGTRGKGSLQPAAGARPALPHAGGNGSRRRARGRRLAQPKDWRPQRFPLPARGYLGPALQR